MSSKGEIITCTCQCGHKHRISEREIELFQGLVEALWKVFKWCVGKEKHEFQIKEVMHLMRHVEYTNFHRWRYFGGLVYSPNRRAGYYGLNMDRCDEFFRGEREIPTKAWKNPITKEFRFEEYKKAHEIPGIMELLNEDGEYVANYRIPESMKVTEI